MVWLKRAVVSVFQRGSRSTMDTLDPADQPLPAIRRDFRWPIGRRRQTTTPHSRSSNRLKQEIARPPQSSQYHLTFHSECDSNIFLVSSSICTEVSVGLGLRNVHRDIPALQFIDTRV